jgi:PAS domain S-box-containing protein
MRGGFLRTLGFQLATATSLLIIGVAVLVVWQVDDILRVNEYQRFSDQLESVRSQFAQQIDTDRELSVTGAVVLANQGDMRTAIMQSDVVAILQVATEFFNRTGAPLQGTPGLQIYSARGNLIVRVHDPLRGQQEAVPPEVIEVIHTQTPLGVIRADELLGPSVVGIAPVFGDDGRLIGAIEVMTALDRAYISDRERVLGVRVALLTPGETITGRNEFAITSASFGEEQRALVEDHGPSVFSINGASYLSTLLTLQTFADDFVADLYLGVPESTILSSVRDVQQAALRTTAIGVVVAIALATGLAVIVVRPIRDLVEAARRIQANDLETAVDTSGPSEVLELGDALDDLRIAIRQTREAMLSVNRDLASRFDASAASLSEASQELAVMHSVLGALSTEASAGLIGVTEHIAQVDWVDGALIALATEDGRLSLAASTGVRVAGANAVLQVVERGLRGQRIESGVIVPDTGANPATASLGAFEIRGLTAQPMMAPDGITGIVAVVTRQPLRLTPSRTDLLRSIAREVALTLERAELAGEVEENRRIAESILREMSDGVLVMDHAGHCLVANPAAARLLGRSRTELVGQAIEDVLPVTTEAIQTLQRRARDPSLPPVAPLLAESDGRRLAVSVGPFSDAEPDRTGMMVLLRDLSAEAEAERVKQDFVSMVGHELRTPLTLIRTTIDLLNEGDAGALNETQTRIMQVLLANTDRLMMLINDLLDMSAIDSGRMQIQPEPMDLVETVHAAIEEVRPSAEAKRHRLSTLVPAPAMTVRADRRRIGQVLANLLGNAVKYTPEGGTIEVVIEERAAWVQVSVRDSGIGIPLDEQTQLFEKFYRTSTGRRTTGGTGLGLAIARSLVEMHGGRIWVESDGLSGSTFSFTLPTRPI